MEDEVRKRETDIAKRQREEREALEKKEREEKAKRDFDVKYPITAKKLNSFDLYLTPSRKTYQTNQ